MRSLKKIVLLATLAALAALGVSVALAASPGDVTSTDLRRLEPVNFLTVCRFSHRRPDDPIVFPGRPGLSHGHTFVGNESTDAFSTPSTLRKAATTCDRSEDTAAYWAPTLLVNDQPVTPVAATVYYRRRTIQRVRAFPQGLEMVAGDSHAMAPQSLRVTWWDCGDHGAAAPSNTVPTCPPGAATSLRLHVRFPDCWDGRRLDSPDHKSHMAYSSRGRCDEVHPVAVPSLSITMQYPVVGGSGVELSSMGQFSGHADFVNAWQQGELKRLVDYCLNALRICGSR
jgi:hypothetical protein